MRNINITSVQKNFLSLLVFTEISAIQINPVVPVKKSTLAEELWKTSKTGDDFDDLAMTRKIVLVWNRSKAPTKSAPLSLDTAGCQPMPNCILICLGMSDKSKLYPNWPNRNWLKFNPTWKLKRILDLLESRAKVHPIHCFLLCLAGKEVLGAYQTSKVSNSTNALKRFGNFFPVYSQSYVNCVAISI